MTMVNAAVEESANLSSEANSKGIWTSLGPSDLIWDQLGPFGSIWSNLEPCGAIWGDLGASVAI